jgi:pimeloyl-ACP methyl ester carboxylesterase
MPAIFSRLPLLGPLFEPLPEGPLPRRREESVGDYVIHSAEYGEVGEGIEAVVLVHGLAGSSRWWAHTVPALARRYHVIVPDLIGFGRTRRPGRVLPSMGDVARVLAAWLERLGVPRCHLVGHSMGGQIALHFAARAPERVRRLVLVDAAGIPRPIDARSVVQFLAGIAPVSSWGSPGFLSVIARDALKAGPITLLQAAHHILADDVRTLLPHIRAPTLVVWGALDRWVPVAHAHELAAGIADARSVVLDGAAHNPMVDRPAEFNRLVLDFLARPAPRP